MRAMVQAAAIRGTPVLVRVPWNEPGAIMRALDAGAEGVIVPMVNTPDEARAAAGASRYPPLGFRSWGALRSGMAQPGFNPALGNEQTICLVMIETHEAVDNVEAILDVPGVDGVFVGPNDLAISHSGANEGAGRSAARRRDDRARRGRVRAPRRRRRHLVHAGPRTRAGGSRSGYSLLGLPVRRGPARRRDGAAARGRARRRRRAEVRSGEEGRAAAAPSRSDEGARRHGRGAAPRHDLHRASSRRATGCARSSSRTALDVSRGPIRDALLQLEREGLVVRRRQPRRGRRQPLASRPRRGLHPPARDRARRLQRGRRATPARTTGPDAGADRHLRAARRVVTVQRRPRSTSSSTTSSTAPRATSASYGCGRTCARRSTSSCSRGRTSGTRTSPGSWSKATASCWRDSRARRGAGAAGGGRARSDLVPARDRGVCGRRRRGPACRWMRAARRIVVTTEGARHCLEQLAALEADGAELVSRSRRRGRGRRGGARGRARGRVGRGRGRRAVHTRGARPDAQPARARQVRRGLRARRPRRRERSRRRGVHGAGRERRRGRGHDPRARARVPAQAARAGRGGPGQAHGARAGSPATSRSRPWASSASVRSALRSRGGSAASTAACSPWSRGRTSSSASATASSSSTSRPCCPPSTC